MFEPMPMRFCVACKGWTPAADEECVHCGLTAADAHAERRKQTWWGWLLIRLKLLSPPQQPRAD